MKQLFYANPLSILSLPTHIQYHMQSFFLLRRLLQSPKNALNTIFIYKNGFNHQATASSNNLSLFLDSRNLGNVPILLVHPGEIIHLAHH